MKTVGVLVAVALLGASQVGAAEKQSVYAVAKVDGKTKRIDGEVYHLVAIKLDPSVLLLNTGLGSSVLLVKGSEGKVALAEGDEERRLEDKEHRYSLCWLRLPAKGEIEVLWGGLSDPKEGEAVLRERLIKAGYAPFKVDVQKLPVVKPGDAKGLLAELDRLAEQPEWK
jgi:hypothetical protein